MTDKTQLSTYERVHARMFKAADRHSTTKLCGSLEILATKDAKTGLTREERMTRHVLIDVLCARHAVVDKAFDAWASDQSTDSADPVPAIVAAARTVGR